MLSKVLLFCTYCIILCLILNHRSQSSICGGFQFNRIDFCVSERSLFCGPLQNNVPKPTCYPWDCEYFMLAPLILNPLYVNTFTHNFGHIWWGWMFYLLSMPQKPWHEKYRMFCMIWHWRMHWTMGVSEFLTPIKALRMCI